MTGTLMGASRALTEETRAKRGVGDGAHGTPRELKTIQDASYRETYQTLLRRFGNVAQPEAVAPIWRRGRVNIIR